MSFNGRTAADCKDCHRVHLLTKCDDCQMCSCHENDPFVECDRCHQNICDPCQMDGAIEYCEGCSDAFCFACHDSRQLLKDCVLCDKRFCTDCLGSLLILFVVQFLLQTPAKNVECFAIGAETAESMPAALVQFSAKQANCI